MPEVMKQGSEYKESEETEVISPIKPKVSKKLIITIAVILGVSIIGAGIYTAIKDSNQKKEVAQQEESIPVFEYSKQELTDLRASGYTGKEIEDYKQQNIDAKALIVKAKGEREALLKKTYIELSDKVTNAASDEYKTLLDNTWLSGKVRVVSAPDAKKYDTAKVKDNVDYVKLPPKGNQLMVKLILDDGTYLFHTVHPTRYIELKDSGNMVVTYDKVKFGNEIFIINIQEIKP